MLNQERQLFERHRDEWMEDHRGEYALIKGEELIGFFEDEEKAISVGGRNFGNDDFLVRRVDETDHEEVHAPALSLGILQSD